MTPQNNRDDQKNYQATRRQNFIKEVIGFGLGMGGALMVSAFVPAINQQFSIVQVLFWGAVIGGVVVNLERFEQAGAALTRKESRPLNIVIGFGIPVGLLTLIFLLS